MLTKILSINNKSKKKKKKQGIVIDSITFAVNIILFNYIPK